MAHKKGTGSTRNGRDSNAQRLGVKRYGGEVVTAGNILVRQRGTKIHPGSNVGRGSDDTLFAMINGIVTFERKGKNRKKISVYPAIEALTTAEAISSEATATEAVSPAAIEPAVLAPETVAVETVAPETVAPEVVAVETQDAEAAVIEEDDEDEDDEADEADEDEDDEDDEAVADETIAP